MSDPAIPIIRLPIDPHQTAQLGETPFRFGGVRMKTTIYVVQSPDLPGATNQTIFTLSVPPHTLVEIRKAED